MSRISRSEMFMRMAETAAERGTCLRARVGAVLVHDNRVISIGYAGSRHGEPHCIDQGCIIGPHGGCVRTIHAEINALNYAERYLYEIFRNSKGLTPTRRASQILHTSKLYITHSPCRICAAVIFTRGIRTVIYQVPYRDPFPVWWLNAHGVLTSSLDQYLEDPRGS